MYLYSYEYSDIKYAHLIFQIKMKYRLDIIHTIFIPISESDASKNRNEREEKAL